MSDDARTTIEKLRANIKLALMCTPHVRGNQISYECGDPWKLLREALDLSDHAVATDDDGGQDRKYKFENGEFVNRLSGEPIPKDEPTIILRARDVHATSVLRTYLYTVEDPKHRQAVQDRIDEFEQFAMDHPERMKEPGITGHIQLNEEGELPTHSQL
jgi:hypothetical protein